MVAPPAGRRVSLRSGGVLVWPVVRRRVGRAREVVSRTGDVSVPGGPSSRHPCPVDVWTTSWEAPSASPPGLGGVAHPARTRHRVNVDKAGWNRRRWVTVVQELFMTVSLSLWFLLRQRKRNSV